MIHTVFKDGDGSYVHYLQYKKVGAAPKAVRRRYAIAIRVQRRGRLDVVHLGAVDHDGTLCGFSLRNVMSLATVIGGPSKVTCTRCQQIMSRADQTK